MAKKIQKKNSDFFKISMKKNFSGDFLSYPQVAALGVRQSAEETSIDAITAGKVHLSTNDVIITQYDVIIANTFFVEELSAKIFCV